MGTIYDMIKLDVQNDQAQSRGFIMDGLPLNTLEPLQTSQLDFLTSVVQDYDICVLIDMQISDQDLIRRRAGLWLDPVTNINYPAAQILYSKRRRNEGWIDGDEDSVLKEEMMMTAPESEISPDNSDDKEVDLDAEEGEPDADKGKRYIQNNLTKNRKAYPILSEKILDR